MASAHCPDRENGLIDPLLADLAPGVPAPGHDGRPSPLTWYMTPVMAWWRSLLQGLDSQTVYPSGPCTGAALAVAVTIPQHKLISDVAAAQEVLATRQRLGDDVIGHAHAIKTEALAGLGDLLKRMPKSGGGRRPKGSRGSKGRISGTKSEPLMGSPSTLAELGIDKKTSSLAQRLAALSGTERNAVAARDKTLAQVTREKVAKVRAKRLALPDAKFRVVYADPPWQYRDKADAGSVQSGGAARQYPTMSIVELCDLGVSSTCEP